MIQVSVIIVNYNTKEITNNCIESIKKFTKDIAYEIILIDNASGDGSVDFFSNVENIIFIKSDVNLGFGRANNLGAEYAKGDFLFLLNSDTILIENSILKFYNFFCLNEERLKLGVLGCLMVDEENNINGYGGKIPSIQDLNQRNLKRIPLFRSYVSNSFTKNDLISDYFEIGYVLGADMFLRKDIFEKIGGFDPNYFMYYEESDLQKIINGLGYKHYIFTNTKIIHLEGGSFSKEYVSNMKRIIIHSSEVYYAKKNYPSQYTGFKVLDFVFLLLSLLNFKYTFSENIEYIQKIIKKY